MKKRIQWDLAKNIKLKQERGISFDEVLVCVENQRILDVRNHPSKKYEHQMVLIIEVNGYIYYVPYVEDENGIFLKTIIPSRQLTKKYLKEKAK